MNEEQWNKIVKEVFDITTPPNHYHYDFKPRYTKNGWQASDDELYCNQHFKAISDAEGYTFEFNFEDNYYVVFYSEEKEPNAIVTFFKNIIQQIRDNIVKFSHPIWWKKVSIPSQDGWINKTMKEIIP